MYLMYLLVSQPILHGKIKCIFCEKRFVIYWKIKLNATRVEEFLQGSFIEGEDCWHWIHDFVPTFGVNNRLIYMA